ncbi:MAG: cell wall hydrolase [Sphingorhabdus sp.]
MHATTIDTAITTRSARPALIFFALLGALALLAINMRDTDISRLWSMVGLGEPVQAAVPAMSEKERKALLSITEDALAKPELSGEDALAQNAALPFSDAAILAAQPFAVRDVFTGAGLTALQCMTQAVYYEAAYEPLAGRRAVAQVVLNRVRHPAFPNSVCGVVYQGSNKRVCQFSFTCDGSLNRKPSAAAWAAAEAVAHDALSGYVERSVGQATHYHANYVSPYWAPKLTKISQLGAHIFYRWPGKWGMPAAFTDSYSGVEGIPAFTPNLAALPTDAAVAAEQLTVDQQTEALAREKLVPELVPMRAAANDVGGRLDISRGWTLTIPNPKETRGASAAIALRQSSGGAEPAQPAAGAE